MEEKRDNPKDDGGLLKDEDPEWYDRRTTENVPVMRGSKQFLALMRKNLLLKTRSPLMTFFEFLCPIGLLWILHATFLATGVTNLGVRHYTDLNVEFPGFLMSYFVQAGLIPSPGNLWSGAIDEGSFLGFGRRLQEKSKEDLLLDMEANRENFETFLASPMPIPTLGHYVLMHKVLLVGYNQTVGSSDLLQEFESSADFGKRWGNILSLGTVHVVGNEDLTSEFVEYCQENYPNATEEFLFREWTNPEEALDYMDDKIYDEKTWAMIDFTNFGQNVLFDEENNEIHYTIRMNGTVVPTTRLAEAMSYAMYNDVHQMYFFSGFLTFQRTINEFFFTRADGCKAPNEFDIWAAPMPNAAFEQNQFFEAISMLLPLVLAMAFLFPVSRLVKTLVEEKESRMKQTLFIFGVKPWALWLANIVFNMLFFILLSACAAGFLGYQVIQYSDKLLLFMFFASFAFSVLSLSFFIASFFSSSKLASILGPVIFFSSILPRYIFLGTREEESVLDKVFASLAPCTAFSFGAEILTNLEYANIGVQWWNVSSGGFDMSVSILMMLFDFVFYIILAWYVEQVFPSEFGVQRKWYFCFTYSYWRSFIDTKEVYTEIFDVNVTNNRNMLSKNYEEIDDSLDPKVKVQNLVKQYSKKSIPAVKHLNMALYEDEITCLLGHNGAGKSTTISIMTGLFPPSAGDCIVYGKSIRNNLNGLREIMGVCPQHNVIYDDLSVYEHISLFETLKGGRATRSRIEEKVKEVGLEGKLHSYAKTLSGGQKRKLCVAMAFCGEPKFILFDEPTSGMDPYSRRATWDLLRRKKKGRVMLLTTHFMEEAELLADRVAVLSSGSLQCFGTNLFLKQRFGLGYNLTLVIDNKQEDVNGVREKAQSITEFLVTLIPGVQLLRQSAREIIYRFPPGSENEFSNLFNIIENQKDLGISSYGVSNTTLEEVFLRLAEEAEHDKYNGDNDENPDIPQPNNKSLITASSSNETRLISRVEQIAILFKKRLTILKRDRKGFFFQIFIPVAAIAFALVFLILDVFARQPPMKMDLDLAHESPRISVTSLAIGGDIDQNAYKNLEEGFFNDYPEVDVHFVPDVQNSSEMSNYMIDTFHTHEHPLRFASYVFNDTIDVNILINWEDVDFVLNNLNRDSIGEDGKLTITGFQGDSRIEEQFELSDVANLIYKYTQITPYTDIDVGALQEELEEGFEQVSIFSFISIDKVLNVPAGNDKITVEEFFYQLNILSGGTQELDATYYVSIESIILDFVSEEMMAKDIALELVDLESTIGINELHFIFPSKEISLKGVSLNGVPVAPEINISLGELMDGEFFLEDYGSVVDLIVMLLPNAEMTSETLQIKDTVTILHNTSIFHSITGGYQTYAEYSLKNCTKNSDAKLVAINYPFPLSHQEDMGLNMWLSIFAAFSVLIPLCYAPAAFMIFVVKERKSKSKHLQLVSGVDIFAYWVATYLFDICLWALFTVLTMFVFLCYGQNVADPFVGDATSFFCVFLLIFGYGLSVIPFSYILSRNFSNYTTAQIMILGLLFIFGFITSISFCIMLVIGGSVARLGMKLSSFFRVFPPFNIGWALIDVSIHPFYQEFAGETRSVFEICYRHFQFLYGLSIPYFAILIILEYSGDGGSGGFLGNTLRFIKNTFNKMKLRFFSVRPSQLYVKGYIDSDVLDERSFVLNNKKNLKDSASVLLVDMWKVFPPSQVNPCGKTDVSRLAKRAVSELTVAVKGGEIFGLLGVNGAGKTTTMAILTGDLHPTRGEAYVAGFDVTGKSSGDVIKARQKIGFCPQIDPLLDLMTARETLHMYGSLRGIPKADLDSVVENLIKALTLEPHADKPAGVYSGGNKRKLSLGIAIIGNPKVLFIDEASSGMDPVARRKMWELISIVGEQRSVILTTHAMEEAEALCTRLGIMVAGQMRCIGSVQHLKSKFLDGYTVDLQCKMGCSMEDVDNVISAIQNVVLPGSELSEKHGRYLKFDIPNMATASKDNIAVKCGLGYTFGMLQQLKENPKYMIEEYSVSQCTLEQVFISLAKT